MIIDDLDQLSSSDDEEIADIEHNVNLDLDSLFLQVSVDTEFEGNEYISLQVTMKNDELNINSTFMILDEKFKQYIPTRLNNEYKNILYFDDLSKTGVSFLLKYISIFLFEKYGYSLLQKVKIYLYFYYSLKDLNLSFGSDNMRSYYFKKNKDSQGFIDQKRNVRGFLNFEHKYQNNFIKYKVILKDLYGWGSRGGLQALISSFGLEENLELKKLLDEYKSEMSLAVKKYPEQFIKYSLNDSVVLLKIVQSQIDTFNTILKTTFSINDPDKTYTVDNIPMTVGSLVSSLWDRYFDSRYLKTKSHRLAFLKQGVLNSLHSNYDENKELFERLKKINSFSDLKDLEQNSSSFSNFEKLFEKGFFYTHL